MTNDEIGINATINEGWLSEMDINEDEETLDVEVIMKMYELLQRKKSDIKSKDKKIYKL